MNTSFTLEDICDFLKRKFALNWNYEVWDKKSGEKRQVTIEDFDYSGMYSTTDLAIFDKSENSYALDVYLSDFKFITYKDEPNVMGSGSTTYVNKDLSYSWIDYLLHTHGEEYAKRLFKNSARKKKKIKEQMVEKINNYTQQVKNEYSVELEYCKALEEKALTYLTDSDIVNLIETI